MVFLRFLEKSFAIIALLVGQTTARHGRDLIRITLHICRTSGVMMELEAAAQGFLARMSPRMSPTAGAAGLVDTPVREGNWRVIRKTIRHAVF
jgi:hypothetical protein